MTKTVLHELKIKWPNNKLTRIHCGEFKVHQCECIVNVKTKLWIVQNCLDMNYWTNINKLKLFFKIDLVFDDLLIQINVNGCANKNLKFRCNSNLANAAVNWFENATSNFTKKSGWVCVKSLAQIHYKLLAECMRWGHTWIVEF